MSLWPLIGIAVVVVGFVLRFNPLLVVVAAALATGIAFGLSTGLAPLPAAVKTLETFGKAFNENRYITLTWMILPVIGLLERAGLQEKARDLVAAIKGATTGRLLILFPMQGAPQSLLTTHSQQQHTVLATAGPRSGWTMWSCLRN